MDSSTDRAGGDSRAEFRTLLLDVLRDGSPLATRVCRVCLKRSDDIVRLTDTCSVKIKACAGTYTLAEILSHVTRTKVEEEGGGGRVLPTGVCPACVQACVEAYIFMRTFELNTSSLEKCVELLSCHLEEELRGEQERLIVTVLPELHDYKIFHDLNIQNVHFDSPDPLIRELCWAKMLRPERTLADCTMCERSFTTRLLLRQHEAVHPPHAKHICRLCGNGYKQKRILSRHVSERHGGAEHRKLLCVMCGNTYATPYSLFCHQAVYHGTSRLYYCASCYYRGRSEEAMLRHIRANHPHDVDAHYSVLEPNEELREQLDAATETGACVPSADHSDDATGPDAEEEGEDGQAASAGPAVSSKVRLVRRRLLAAAGGGGEGGGLHVCHVCGRSFPRAVSLRRHVDRDHQHMECKQCRKVFRIRTRYERHLRLHITNPDLKVYKCEYCEYSAKQRRHLVQHTTRRHTDIRPYTCEVCGKGFVKQNEVRSHMVVHTRERPELCSLCDKRFVNKAALLYHTRLHTGERPYECAQCGERFLSASRRGAHARSKHGPRPQCVICKSTYTNNQVLQKHIRNVHMKSKDPRARKLLRKRLDDSPQPYEQHHHDQQHQQHHDRPWPE